MSGKVKGVAVEEAERIKTLTSDAMHSGAYLYPLRVRKPFFSLQSQILQLVLAFG